MIKTFTNSEFSPTQFKHVISIVITISGNYFLVKHRPNGLCNTEK